MFVNKSVFFIKGNSWGKRMQIDTFEIYLFILIEKYNNLKKQFTVS